MSILQKIRFILTPQERKSAIVLLCLMTVGMVLEMVGVGVLFPVMLILGQNDLASHARVRPVLEFLGNPTQVQLIVGAMLALVVAYFVKNMFLAFLAWRRVRVTSAIQVQLMQRLFSAYMRQPYTFHLQRNSAQLGYNIGQAGAFIGVIQSGMTIFTDSLAMFGISSLLLLVEPLGAVIAVIILGAAVWSFHRITRARITRWGVALQYHEAQGGQHMAQGFGGVKDVKLLGRENNFLEKYHLHSSKGARIAGSQAILQQFPRLWLELLALVGLTILVLSMIAQGVGVARIVPTLALFAAAVYRMTPAATRILAAVQNIRYSLPSVDLLYEETKLLVLKSTTMRKESATLSVLQTDIRLSNLNYTYPNAPIPSLNGISIIIQKGESVGFIGPSGSGKSTLVDIILGLLPPEKGLVTVDGQDIQTNLRAWQDQIGYVPQAIYLTDDTLRHNVAFGLSDEAIDDAALKRAIRDAQLEEFVASLPKGIDTMVGERGIRLSGGQRQRIGIARALYHDPAVLVLDEATSALDTATEQGVMQAVTALQGSKTILIVAHRLSTVEHCDRLYRLEKGMLVAEGAPAEMLASSKVTFSAIETLNPTE